MKLFVVACLVLILCGVSLASETEEDTVLATEPPKGGDEIALPVGSGDVKAEAEFSDDFEATAAQEADDSEGILSRCKIRCTCKAGECKCCKFIRIAGDRHNACFVVSYKHKRLRVTAKVDYNNIRTRSRTVSGNIAGRKLTACGSFPRKCAKWGKKVCARLTVTRSNPQKVYFKGTLSVAGKFNCDISTS